jgi:hypothetical protein
VVEPLRLKTLAAAYEASFRSQMTVALCSLTSWSQHYTRRRSADRVSTTAYCTLASGFFEDHARPPRVRVCIMMALQLEETRALLWREGQTALREGCSVVTDHGQLRQVVPSHVNMILIELSRDIPN